MKKLIVALGLIIALIAPAAPALAHHNQCHTLYPLPTSWRPFDPSIMWFNGSVITETYHLNGGNLCFPPGSFNSGPKFIRFCGDMLITNPAPGRYVAFSGHVSGNSQTWATIDTSGSHCRTILSNGYLSVQTYGPGPYPAAGYWEFHGDIQFR